MFRRVGLELIEAAPGMDLQRDIIERMKFVPIIRLVAEMAMGKSGTAAPRTIV